MRIVLDTNCLIQSIGRYSQYRPIWDSVISGENVLCVSNEIIDEYVEILERLFNADLAKVVVETILENPYTEFVTPYYHFELIKSDPDDNKFVDCAISANARYVVTNDHHYDILRQTSFPKVDIISLVDFLKILK